MTKTRRIFTDEFKREAVALRELGGLDRSPQLVRWLLDLDLRRHAQAGLIREKPETSV